MITRLDSTGTGPEAAGFGAIEAFAGIGPAALAALRAAARIEHVSGGDLLVRYGETADTLYIVASGRFLVQLPSGAVVAEIEAGEPIGELAFFAAGTRTADVRASRDSTVLALTREAYDSVSGEHREIADAILAAIARRLAVATASTAAMAARPGRVIAILPAARAPLPEGLAERMVDELTQHGTARLIRAADCPAGLGPESAGFGDWIGMLEGTADRVVLAAGPDEAWNRAIARNTDDLLLVAPLGEQDTACSPLEHHAMGRVRPDDRMLLLWRADARMPISGTGRWLANREVKLHHHIALDDPASLARAARFVAGRANGVVLAGGGALGCAHLGVMQALRDHGIPMDFYAGTSAGAAMGGAVAQGLTPEETLEQMREMFITRKAMRRMTVPLHSLLDQRVFDAELLLRYSDRDIADLPYNFLAVSTNLSTNRIHVHRRGPLWEAVRASGSLPTVLPPFVTRDGDVLVDGGLLDNIPIDVTQAAKAGPNVVVALHADAGAPWRIDARYSDVRTRGQLLRDLVLRRKPERAFPSLIEVMSRSMVVASEAGVESALEKADVLLIPPIPEGMQLLDWDKGTEAAEAARRYTAEAIALRPELAAMITA